MQNESDCKGYRMKIFYFSMILKPSQARKHRTQEIIHKSTKPFDRM